ncbi:MAG: helix-turn-helix domain-containing protein [Gammaproteobacteria bacterium]|nr:helix-turn-helix domain-containing protein [Gammaproteobacteria bacterium]
MTMQLPNTAIDNNITPITNRAGFVQSVIGGAQCRTCNIRGGCLIEQLKQTHEHSFQTIKNRRELSKDEHVFYGGDDTNAIYTVSRGSLKSYMLMENGEEQILDFYTAGDVFGLDAMGRHCHISSTVALETTVICKLPLNELQQRVLGQEFFSMISENLLRDHNQMLMLARKGADGRLASFLMNMSQRSKKSNQPDDEIILSMTRRDIANYLGMAIETVSRTLRRFQDTGMLKVTQRKVKIYDFEKLLIIAGTQAIC